jgi:hypothetical protein
MSKIWKKVICKSCKGNIDLTSKGAYFDCPLCGERNDIDENKGIITPIISLIFYSGIAGVLIYLLLVMSGIYNPNSKTENYKTCKADKVCWKESIDSFFEAKYEDYKDGKIDKDWNSEEVLLGKEIETIINSDIRNEITEYFYSAMQKNVNKITKEIPSARRENQY